MDGVRVWVFGHFGECMIRCCGGQMVVGRWHCQLVAWRRGQVQPGRHGRLYVSSLLGLHAFSRAFFASV